MRRPLLTHCVYALITIVMFVLGSLRVQRSGEQSDSDASNPHRGILSQLTLSTETPMADRFDFGSGSGSEIGRAGGTGDPLPDWARLLERAPGDVPLSSQQLNELVLLATRSGSPVARRRAFDRLLAELAGGSIADGQIHAVRAAMASNVATRAQWKLFDYAWGAADPKAAIAHLDVIDAKYRDRFLGDLLPGIASVEPRTAIALVDSLGVGDRPELIGRLIEGLADHDPAIATDYVLALAQSNPRQARDHMQRLAKEVLDTKGFDAGKQWAEELPAGPLLGHALMPIANEFANRDPEGAAQWAEGFTETPGASRVFGEVVREWGDWHQASDWVESLPEGRGQLDAISAVWGFRGAHEPQDAVQDIIAMPESPERNFALNGFISGLARQDGEAATIWAAEITEPHLRESAVLRAGQQFFRQDPQAANDWFASSSGIPAERWQNFAN
jgi:hypothetical protein